MWVAFVALSGYLASYLADALTTDIDFTDRPEAVRLVISLRRCGEQKLAEFVVVVSDNATSADAEYMEFVGQLQTAVTALGSDKIEFVGSYLDESGPVSEDGRTVLLPVTMADPDIDDASAPPSNSKKPSMRSFIPTASRL